MQNDMINAVLDDDESAREERDYERTNSNGSKHILTRETEEMGVRPLGGACFVVHPALCDGGLIIRFS
jgi:hypothetical protein